MKNEPRRIARRSATPLPRSGGLSTTSRLPDDLLSEQIKRLAAFAAVGGGLWAFGFAMDRFIVPAFLGPSPMMPMAPRGVLVLELAAVVVSMAMFAYVRFGPHSVDAKTRAGVAYMLFCAAGVAALNNLFQQPTMTMLMHLSWITVVILVFSITAPLKPRPMLLVSLAAAALDPLALWIAHLRGASTPTMVQTLVLYLPNFIVAIAATAPAHIFHHLGRRLREAQELGSYTLLELLGEGGMGEVWRAEHRLLARNAAVKIVRPEVLGGGTDVDARTIQKRFEREARATASLSSPHTIQVFDFGLSDAGTFYYVMELLIGRDLETLIRTFGPMGYDRATFLLRQICHSLADAHARGMVHRDIKPANIYVCRMGRDYDFVKVLDFGLVKMNRRGGGLETTLTVDQHTTGTPAYMAPEVILGDTDVDRRADVYSLGCVAYYLLTGQLVFEADTPMKMMMQHVQAIPIPPSQRTELPIPPELDAIVMQCLEKDPARRPSGAEALLDMALRCRTCDTWNHEIARGWWNTHLPEFTQPLTVEEPADPLPLDQIQSV